MTGKIYYISFNPFFYIISSHSMNFTEDNNTPGIVINVRSQGSKRLCICVLVVSHFLVSTICLLDFGTVQTVWYFFFHNVRFIHIYTYLPWREHVDEIIMMSGLY
jgi:hypothetical protein